MNASQIYTNIWNAINGENSSGNAYYSSFSEKFKNKRPTTEQINCVESDINDHLLINSCAGSGKTFFIVLRIIYLLSSGVHPTDIIVLTYTNNAVSEIKNRLSKHFNITNVPVLTFHKFCQVNICKFKTNIGENQLEGIVKDIIDNEIIGILTKTEIFNIICESRYKVSSGIDENDLPEPHQNIYKSFQRICKKMKEDNPRSFELDSDYLGTLLVSNNSEKFQQLRIENKYILIDEMQDVNIVVFSIIKKMIENKNCKLTLVGDEKQKIYSYSGLYISTEEVSDYFQEQGAFIRSILKNHRCHENIHKAAMQLFSRENPVIDINNFDFRVFTMITSSWTNQCKNAIVVVKEVLKKNKTICCLFRTNKEKKSFYDKYIKENSSFNNTNLSLSTIHSSKGAEFDAVIILTVSEMNIPKYKAEDAVLQYDRSIKEKIDEEKRVLYVGITRGRDFVLLLSPQNLVDAKDCFGHRQIKTSILSQFVKYMEPFISTMYSIENFVSNTLEEIYMY